MSLHFTKKLDEVGFLHADKQLSFLQVDFNILGIKVSLMDMIKHSQSTQNNNFAIFLTFQKKLEIEFIFCIQIKIKVSTS